MDEYKSRLSAYLSDMVREELEKYDGGFTDEWNDQRKKNAEVLGYKLSDKSDIKEGAAEFWQDMFRPGNIPNKYINQLIKKKGELPSKSHIKSIYKDNGNPSSSQLSKAFKQLAKEKYIKKQGSLWKWESGFAWRTGTELESVNEELQNSQGEQTDFKKGDLVKDINPDCPHHGSEGKVTKVGKGTITFDVTNNGRTYKEGDELEKTVDQMVKLSQSPFADDHEETEKQPMGESVIKEAGMGILDSDQADILQGIVLRNKNKNLKGILSVALKSGHFKNVDKKELLGYIDGAKQFVKYMKSHPMESVNESRYNVKKAIKIAKKMSGNMTGAVKKIEKIQRGLSKQIEVEDALRTANESVNEGFTKYHIRLTKTPGWYGVWDKNGKQKFEGDRKYVTKHLKKLKTRMGNFQLKSLIDVATKRKGKDIEFDVVESVTETKKRDYKAEYKKYGSSTKAKKYRAELNQYNRKKGTYGNGDGKDASHKGGKIAGFEKESTNRGRREKSRLKKEDIREFKGTQAIHVYLGGIVDAMRKAGLKAKTAKQMKHGFSKSRDKIGFFIDVEQRGFDKKEMYTLQVEIDRDGNLWYLSGHRPMKLGKWADTSKIVRMWKALNKVKAFGQDAIFKKR